MDQRKSSIRQNFWWVSQMLVLAFVEMTQAREAIHTVFLHHAIKAGLTMGIVNAGMIGLYDDLVRRI